MNNIKTVEVIKALPGLEVGDTLTRLNADSNFELKVETVTDTYTAKRIISISESLLNKDEFKAVEWFNPIKTNKQRITELEQENANLRDKIVASIERECIELKKEEQLDTVLKRIDTKIVDYTKESSIIEKKLDSNRYSQDYEEYAMEALTVYRNMITLLEELKK